MFKYLKEAWLTIKDEKKMRIILYLFLFTTLSGAIRKWVVSSNVVSNAILGIQLLIPFLFVFFKGAFKFNSRQQNLFVVLVIYIFSLFLLAANPLGATLGHGILGIMVHLGFWLPMFIYLKDREEYPIEKLIPFFIVICLAQVVLGSIQSQLPGDAFINRYAAAQGEGLPDAYVGDAVRVTGTFSYISGYGSFMLFYTLVACALIKIRYQPFILVPFLALGYYGCLISGSRGTTYSYLIIIGLFVLTSVNLKANAKLIGGTLLVVLVLGILNFVLEDPLHVYQKFEESSGNFSERVNGTNENSESRVLAAIIEVKDLHYAHDLFGAGLGSTYQGANALFGNNPNLDGQGYESEPKRVILEGGYFLLILRFIMLFYLILNLKGNFFFKAGIVVLSIFVFSIIYNTYNCFYVLLGLILLDRISSNKETQYL